MTTLPATTDRHAGFHATLRRHPLIAILRGLTPEEAPAIGAALVESGFRLLEVPLNSPRPCESIARLREHCPEAWVGAGTVTNVRQVAEIAAAGGRLIVSPNTDPAVIAATRAAGLVSLPGVFTPTEAFAALDAGADVLKLFPAEAGSPAMLKALRAVLPAGTPFCPVGGITPTSIAAWHAAGAVGFGIGSALYRPGRTASAVAAQARAFVAAWDELDRDAR